MSKEIKKIKDTETVSNFKDESTGEIVARKVYEVEEMITRKSITTRAQLLKQKADLEGELLFVNTLLETVQE